MSDWTTTPSELSELLNVFRDALLAIVPVVERTMMAWRDEEAYDDWDAIADVLYEQLVVASVRWSLAEADHAALRMPPYNTLVESYNDLRFFAVTGRKTTSTAERSFSRLMSTPPLRFCTSTWIM